MSPVSHEMLAERVVQIMDALEEHGADACIGGGWAVDALLGTQTRPHGDLDLWVSATGFERFVVAVATRGVDRLLLPWPGDRPWNFVLHDGHRLRVDLHLYEPLPTGEWHYGSVVDHRRYPGDALRGRGTIAGREVRCETPQWALACHEGYPPRPVDHHDVPRLCARYGLDLPTAYRSGR